MRLAAIRPVVIAILLGLTAVLAAVLTAQAVFASREHRATAERVLHDYAALGAEGVGQRLRSALNNRFSNALAAASPRPGSALPTPDIVRNALPATMRDVIDDSSRIIHVGPQDSLATTLVNATHDLPDYAYFGVLWMKGAHGPELLVYQPFRAPRTDVVAFTIPEQAFSSLLGRLEAKDPGLPMSLTHGVALDSGVGLRVTSAHGVLTDRRFDTQTVFHSTYPLNQPFGDLVVEVSVSESLAPSLIIGGLPRSRVPLLIVLMSLTILLTAAAGDQLRRELELSRLRDDFVSSVSHELRTPLAQIRLFAETLRLGRVRSPEERDESLRIVENESRRLEHLVENLLHFSRTERRRLQITRAPVNLTSLLGQVVAEFAPLAARSHSLLQFECTEDINAAVDPAAIRQVVLNLLDNAVKYGRRGQSITVRLYSARGGMRIEVDDQGDGIAERDRDRIWERFWRGEPARTAGVTGTGVGLAIVRDLTRLHDGTASAGATPGGGARMTIFLPTVDA